MSFIPRVERWIADVRRRLERAREGGPLDRELKSTLAMYEKLLAELRAKHPKPARDPGED
jgi:hypothetical protein